MSVSALESMCRLLSSLSPSLSLSAQQLKETMLTIQITATILPSQFILVHPRRKVTSSCYGDNGFARFLLVPITHVVDVAAAHPVEKTRENKRTDSSQSVSAVCCKHESNECTFVCFVCVHLFCVMFV